MMLVRCAIILSVAALCPWYVGPASGEALAPEQALSGARLLAGHGEPGAALELLGGVARDTDRIVQLDVRLLTEEGRFADADRILEQYPPMDAPDDMFRYYLQRARLCFDAGDTDRAAEFLRGIAERDDPYLTGYRDYLLARVQLSRKNIDDAVTAAEAAARTAPAALMPLVDEVLAETYLAVGRTADAARVARQMRNRSSDARERARLLAMEFGLHYGAGQTDASREVAVELAVKYGRSADAKRVVEELVTSTPREVFPTREILAFADVMIAHDRDGMARSLLDAARARKLSDGQREHLRLLDSQYYYSRGAYARAAELAKPAFTDPGFKRESVLMLARCERRIGNAEFSARLYVYFSETWPNDAKASEALFVASRLYRRLGSARREQDTLDRLRKSYPSSYYAQAVTLEEGLRRADRGEYGGAINVLSSQLQRSRRTDAASLYYLGDTHRRAGDVDNSELILAELRTLNPNSFYLYPRIAVAYRRPAMASSGTPLLSGTDGVLDFLSRAEANKTAAWDRIHEVANVSTPGDAADSYDACIERARFFLDTGFRDWGALELEEARDACFESTPAMMELARVYDAYAMPWHSVRMYQRVHDRIPWQQRREHRDAFQWLMYPTPFPQQVLGNATRHDLPPHLVFAMIREESRFDADAVSRVGALGLMQLMPETGRQVARAMELPEWVDEQLLDPEVNVTLGTWYAASLVKQGGGDYLWMLAAYNAGPGNAKRWFEDGDEVVRVVDGIDYKETRNYVRRIVESASIYHSLYFEPAAGVR